MAGGTPAPQKRADLPCTTRVGDSRPRTSRSEKSRALYPYVYGFIAAAKFRDGRPYARAGYVETILCADTPGPSISGTAQGVVDDHLEALAEPLLADVLDVEPAGVEGVDDPRVPLDTRALFEDLVDLHRRQALAVGAGRRQRRGRVGPPPGPRPRPGRGARPGPP